MSVLFPCFVLDASEHPAESILTDLLTANVDQTLVCLRELPLERDDAPLIAVGLRELRSGMPIDPAEVGPALSAEGRQALLVSSPDPSQASLRLFDSGESAFGWQGGIERFLAELPGGADHRGERGFAHAVRALAGVGWEELRQAVIVALGDEEACEVADVDSALLLRGRALGLPVGMPRCPDCFRFHVPSDAPEEPGDRMTLALLDPRVYQQLWREAPAAEAAAFLEAIEPIAPTILGPLAAALPEVLETLEGLDDPEKPLAEASGAGRGDLLEVYEALAMASAVGYLTGDTVSYFDERFFPLLSLADDDPVSDVLAASLEDIAGLGVPAAMAEVLPYSVPEGTLLECFADAELSPLADWAAKDGEYEGSIFPIDTSRLVRLVERFDPARFAERLQGFLALWASLEPGQVESELRRQEHRSALDRFSRRLEELKILLALAEVNELQPALVFFGGIEFED